MGQMNYMYGTDPGMPSLGTLGQGDMVAVLDAALVNGGTTQSITSITRSGSTATATKTAHGFRNQQRITISGAVQTDYNGTFRIFNVTANTFDFTVANTPTTPATGTILGHIAALGWGIAFTATNQRAYRAPSGLRHYLQVIDSNDTNTARIRAYRSMSGINAGLTGPFPTATQSSTNFRWRRPDPTGFPGITWTVIGDDKRFFIFVNQYSASHRGVYGFGELPRSYKPADAYHTFIIGSGNQDGTDATDNPIFPGLVPQAASQGAGQYYTTNIAMARAQNQSTDSYLCGLIGGFGGGSATATGPYYQTATDGDSSPISGGIELTYVDVVENVASGYWRRGRLPMLGTWNPPDYANNDGAIYTGLTNWPDVIAVRGYGTQGAQHGIMFPIGDWDTVFG